MVKNFILLTATCFLFTLASQSQTPTPSKPITPPTPAAQTPTTPAEPKKPSLAEITFENLEHDYGTIKHAANGVYEFKFTNTGKEPLIITNAHGSCGCTVPEWPKEPIKPGASAAIKVSYDTKRVGPFTKTVTVTTNAKTETSVLTIRGVILESPKEETSPVKKTEEGATPLANPPSKTFPK